jgi:TatA/E family protein of Tat protein translocase
MFRSPLADGLVVLIVLLLFFGPKRLPMLSRSVGESIKEFKGGIADAKGSDDKQVLSSGPAPATESRQPVDTGVERSS